MACVGHTADPWQMPVRKAARTMQCIWDISCTYKYKITRNTPVYQKVCDQSGFGTIPISNSQAVQHCADSWQNVIGTTGITSLLDSFDSRECSRNSDEERQEFARYYLKDFRFLYKDTDRGDKNACKPGCYPVTPLMAFYRNGGGTCVDTWLSRRLLHTSQRPKVPWRSLIPITHPGYLSVL